MDITDSSDCLEPTEERIIDPSHRHPQFTTTIPVFPANAYTSQIIINEYTFFVFKPNDLTRLSSELTQTALELNATYVSLPNNYYFEMINSVDGVYENSVVAAWYNIQPRINEMGYDRIMLQPDTGSRSRVSILHSTNDGKHYADAGWALMHWRSVSGIDIYVRSASFNDQRGLGIGISIGTKYPGGQSSLYQVGNSAK